MSNQEASLYKLLRAALDEDIGRGDVTSLACLQPEMIKATVVAKSGGVLSGLVPAQMAFGMVDSANKFCPCLKDGDRFEAGDLIVEIEGLNQTVLTAERTALNFMAHLSGVATLTNQFAEQVQGTRATILDTRKTTPGWRLLEKQAVKHGGGANHRMGLYDMILVKDNHIAAAGSVCGAIQQATEYLASSNFRLQFDCDPGDIEIEVEVISEAQLREAIECGVRRLLLDNQSVASLSQLVAAARQLSSEVKLEASGGVSLATVAAIAATGVDYISVGALTHSAKACDFSLNVTS